MAATSGGSPVSRVPAADAVTVGRVDLRTMRVRDSVVADELTPEQQAEVI
jgi:hypothetical protein